MARFRIPLLIALGLFTAGLALTAAFTDRHYLLLSVVLLLAALLPLFIRLERRPRKSRELVLLAVLSAIAAVSRIPLLRCRGKACVGRCHPLRLCLRGRGGLRHRSSRCPGL